MSYLLLSFILVPLLAGLLVLLVSRYSERAGDVLAFLTTLYLTGLSIWFYSVRPYNHIIVSNRFLPLVLDGLSHLILLMANGIALLVFIYAVVYTLKFTERGKFNALFLLMLAGVQGVALTSNLLHLFLFVELAAFAAYALVAFGTQAEELDAAFKYFIMGEVASALILLAIGCIFGSAGTLDMAQLAQRTILLKPFILTLLIAGFGMKAAIVPFHSWLPDAHAAAPTPVSAMLSGVIIKVLGIYAISRLLFNVIGMTPQLGMVLMTLGAVSLLIGGLFAIGQWDFKRLLAYHSVSQIGYVILGIGLATPLGLMGGIFHLFNHALFKSLLFLNAGSVEYRTGTRDLKAMGGLSRRMPVTATTSLVASFSIAGLPPFNGFWSKLFIILACVQAGKLWFALAAVIGSVLTLSSFLKVQKYAFFEKLKKEFDDLKEVPWLMGTSMISLALLCFLAGVFFPFVINLVINPAVVALANGLGYSKMILLGGM